MLGIGGMPNSPSIARSSIAGRTPANDCRE
jgi:hypothetical protein